MGEEGERRKDEGVVEKKRRGRKKMEGGGKKRGGRDRGQCSGTSCLYISGRAVL